MSPDPVLTANVYAAGQLDVVIRHALVAFWGQLKEQFEGGAMWVMRYSCAGEHLKIRLHGTEDLAEWARHALPVACDSAFSELPDNSGPSVGLRHGPPIDPEDESESAYPDRSLLWTTYRRNPVCFANEVLMQEDDYVERMTRCFAGGFETTVAAIGSAGDNPGRLQSQLRKALLKAIFCGLSAPGFNSEQRDQYLQYHRDWLLRSLILKADPKLGPKTELAERLITRFSAQAQKAEPIRASIQSSLETIWTVDDDPIRQDDTWSQSLLELHSYLLEVPESPNESLDPFAADDTYPPIFKVFHSLANQMGLSLMDEAFVYHLILAATPSAEKSKTVCMIPGQIWAT